MDQTQRQARAVFLFQAREAHVIMQRELFNYWFGFNRGVRAMVPSIQRGRLAVATLFVVAIACAAGFCVGLPLAIGEIKGAIAFAPWLLLILLLFWMLWRGSLVAKWLAIALFAVQALWIGGGALVVRFEVIPPADDPSSQAIVQYFVYGAAAWTLFSVASALVLALSPSVQEFLRVQRAIYGNIPSDHAE